jgi:hypothetical protein
MVAAQSRAVWKRKATLLDDPARGTLPALIRLTDFDLSLEPGISGRLQPVVQRLRAQISGDGLHALAKAITDEAAQRAPVGVALKDLDVGPSGITLALRVEKSIIRGDLSTRLVLSAPDGKYLRVELADVDVPVWVPLDVMLDAAVKRSDGAVWRDPANRSALILDPAALLARSGVQGRFAPGQWAVTTSDAGVDLTFTERASAG